MGKLHKFKTNIAYVSGGIESYSLPLAPISKIILYHVSGSLSGGSSGSYIANTFLQYITLKKNGDKIVDWNGDVDTDKIPNGIAMLREYNSQKAGVSPKAEYFELILPDAIIEPLEIETKFNTIGNINDGDRTTYTGKLDIYYEMVDLIPKRNVLPYTRYSKFNMADRTGKEQFFIPATPRGYKLYALIFKSEDNATPSDTTFDNIKISLPGHDIFNGRFAEMQLNQQNRSGLALTTGFAIFVLDNPLEIPPNTLQVEIEASTAGTDKELHWISLYANK